MQRTIAAGVGGLGLAVSGAERVCDPGRHVAGLERTPGRSGRRASAAAAPTRRARRAPSKECSMPLRGPGAAALVQEPEARDVAEQPERPADAALVGQVRGERSRRRSTARSRSDADERPRADAEEHGAGRAERHGDDRRGGVVRRARDDARAGEASRLGDLRRERAEERSGRNDLREEARRDVEPLEQVGRPARRCAGRSTGSCVAFVNSVDAACRRASGGRGRGSRSSVSAVESAGSASPAIAASSKSVLIGISWMPVRS